jgi:4a-hydroxytetrahydrobiopterin dehydratase
MTIPRDTTDSKFSENDINERLKALKLKWQVVDGQKLRHVFDFDTFPAAMDFVNQVADVAETADHHPDIHIHYNKVILELWTHSVSGLSDKDFELAKKIEELV